MPETALRSARSKLPAVYLGLVLLRVCFALFGTGYVHPDEYFQNGEVIAGRVLGLHTWLTWEWDPYFPVRSIVPVWVTTGIPLSIIRSISQGVVPSPRTIFTAERLSFLGLSFLLDYTTYSLVPEPVRMYALVLLGSSYVVHTYQVRPFTNSVEAIMVALSLVLLRRLLVLESYKSHKQTSARYLAVLALVAVCGLFTRITFAAFTLPVGLEALKWSLRRSRSSLLSWARLLTPSLLVASLAGLGFVYADTTYFSLPSRTPFLELTPLNFLRYNLLPANLAEHGLHPRWLHLVVNLPMIATPGLLFYAFWAEWDYTYPRTAEKSVEADKKKRGVVETMQKVLYWVRWSGITLLSVQPHQEPRFLIPLITPMVAQTVSNGRILRAGRLFWTIWIVSNAILALLFGILHQGGVVPSLFRVHDVIYDKVTGVSTQDFRVVYWKTYMPPRHLLAVPAADIISNAVEIIDFAGGSPDSVILSLRRPPPTSRSLSTLLVAPFYSISNFEKGIQGCVAERSRVFPHLSLDHIGETVAVGWRDGLSLGIFEVDQTCLNSALAS